MELVDQDPPGLARLSRAQRLGLILLGAVALAFGALVEMRSVFLTHRRTDLDVFLRAAWAVRTGEDLYAITDDHGWHYHYPPLFAILMVPLADPPSSVKGATASPYGLSVALWYLLNLSFLSLGAHWLASGLERRSYPVEMRIKLRGSRRWWALRVLPPLVCVVPIGHTLMRGETNLLLLLLLCATIAEALAGRVWHTGLWLAGAITLKVIPAVLAVFLIWRRELRMAAGCGLGLAVGLGLIPAMCFGPARTAAYFREWNTVLVKPALAGGSDQSRAKELIEMTATDSQSFQSVLHNSIHFDRSTRPTQPDRWVRTAHWAIGALLATVAMVAAGFRRRDSASGEVIAWGLLIVVMILLSPVCHLHYFCLALPLVMGLIMARWERGETIRLRSPWAWLFAIYFAFTLVPNIPGMEIPRDLGMATYGALMLYVAGIATLMKAAGAKTVIGCESA